MSDNDPLIANEPESDSYDVAVAVPVRNRRSSRPVATVGRWVLCILLCLSNGLWSQIRLPASLAELTPLTADCIVGVSLTRWKFVSRASCDAACPSWLLDAEYHRSRYARVHHGFLLYEIKHLAKLAQEIPIPKDSSCKELIALIRGALAYEYDYVNSCWLPCTPLGDIVSSWQEPIEYTLRAVSKAFSPQYIVSVMSQSYMPLHLCNVGSRMKRNRLINPRDPSKTVLQSLIASSSSVVASASAMFRQGHPEAMNASLIIDWLASSSYIEQQRNIWAAAKTFYSVLAKHKGIPLQQLIGTLKPPNGEVLRFARVKLDCVQSLMFRDIFKSMPDNMDIFLYIDSSPQVRGNELFACSFEIFNRQDGSWWFLRRYMPLLALGRDYLGAPGKCVALLWLIFLMAGPCWQQMRRFCSMVRVILTDMGTERLLYSICDLLPDFFELMFGIVCAIPPQPRLFPNCLCMPGWQHGWDTVLRRGLRSLRFFPTWITMMRGLVNFMRSPLLLDALVRHVCSAGFPIIAEMLSDCKGKVPSIAEWRWGTLLAAMEALHAILNTLRSHFAEKLYKNATDPSKIKAARAALYSIAFK